MKRLGTTARERNIGRSKLWRFNVKMTYHARQFILVDESAANGRTAIRNYGRSKRGTVARTNKSFFHRGVNHSVLGPFVFDHGFLDISVIQGAYDNELFWVAFNQVVVRVPCLRPALC